MSEKKPEWQAHLWLGADLAHWLRLMGQARFRFSWKHLHVAPIGLAVCLSHSFLRVVQNRLHPPSTFPDLVPPIFILGHWRSGTTLLHELLITDPAHGFPTTYQCFDPLHPLLTEKLVRDNFQWLLPQKRPMDNMEIGWDRPQEDEFALALMGLPSPYNWMAFPNEGYPSYDLLNIDSLPARQQLQWERGLMHFLKMLQYNDSRRLVLKSPTHTCRIPTLMRMFPDARFIYITRDPYSVYPSTVNLWKRLTLAQGLQVPKLPDLEHHVVRTYRHVIERYQNTRKLIPDKQLYEIRYEDLVANPRDSIASIYQHLSLGDFERIQPGLDGYLTVHANYEKNKWQMDPAMIKYINDNLSDLLLSQCYPVRSVG
ncbi:MAG: sulfotransferase [Zavarzinella sp.]